MGEPGDVTSAPGSGPILRRSDVADAICSVPTCPEPVRARGLCGAHYKRWNKDGNVRPDVPLKNGKGFARWSALHMRLRDRRGPANTHPCAWPECNSLAYDWALDHRIEGLALHADPDGRDAGRAYCLDLNAYIPLCRHHHVHLDQLLEFCSKAGHRRTSHGVGSKCSPCQREVAHRLHLLRQDAAGVLGISGTEFKRRYGQSAHAVADVLSQHQA
jgi:hypothetical protein